jgi:RNA polymerase sigma factor (sigma-70 family)
MDRRYWIRTRRRSMYSRTCLHSHPHQCVGPTHLLAAGDEAAEKPPAKFGSSPRCGQTSDSLKKKRDQHGSNGVRAGSSKGESARPYKGTEMASGQRNGVIGYLRRATLLRDGAGLTDGQLLADYISRRDEAAVTALVRRHGPMVWGVCRRVLSNGHDAEDAFQATFLVLVRRAASIAAPELLANWLYGVARKTAMKARATVAKRKVRERQVTDMPEPAEVERDPWNDLQPLLDQELSRLPDIYRVVIVLCDLEGKSRKEAARYLGLPEGTVGSRLARARVVLAKRLTERGVALSCAGLAVVLAQNVASAVVPSLVVSNAIEAASFFAAGQVAATGPVSVKVAALTKSVLKAMMMNKLKAVIAVTLVLGFISAGTTVATLRSAAQDKPLTAKEPIKKPPEPDNEAFTAWGEEVGGLQAGLGFHPGQKRAYSQGESVKLVVRVRNVGKEAVKFQYLREFFLETPPTVTDGKGKTVRLGRASVSGLIHLPVVVNLAPGKEIELTGSQPFYELKLKLKPASLYETGRFQLQYERVFGNSSSGGIKVDPTLSRLATGKLELEIKTPAPKPEPRDDKPTPKDLGKIEPPGGVPLFIGRKGEPIRVDGIEKARKRLEAVPAADLEKWVVELERIIDKKLKDGVPSARQVCRTDFVIHMSVAFDDLNWNAKTADDLFRRAQTMPASEAKAWKEAFEALLKKEIGQTDTEVLDGGPEWAIPLVLIPVDTLHEGQKYSVERGKKYRTRLKQLTADDVSLWKDKVDEFGGTALDAAVNIILLDDYFDKERFQRDKFKAAIRARKK